MDKKTIVILLSFFISSFILYPVAEDLQKIFPSSPSSKAQLNDTPLSNISNFPFCFFALFLPSSFEERSIPPKNGIFSHSLSSHSQLNPAWWEIRLHLVSTGNYTCKEGKKAYTGDYSFTLLWTGCMEQDMDDYLIYHENCDLLEWKAQEKSSDLLHILPGSDFSGKPSFDFHYIFRRGKDLHFDFKVDSFYVPQNDSDHKFYLTLPVTQENTREPSPFNYNAFVKQGSNSICIEEDKIYLNTIEKSYTWKWKHQKRLGEQKRLVSFTNSHKAKVKVSIMPHY